MNKREIPVMNVGISLIILIFMNICLAAFAVLSLQNALSDYALSKKTATHTTQYYAAVNKVQEQLAEKNQKLQEEQSQKNQEFQKQQSQQKQKLQKQQVQNNQELQKNQTQNQKQPPKSQSEPQSEIQITETVSKRQQLVVTLQLDKAGTCPQYYIEKWQLCTPDDWQADDSLDVYKGGEQGGK